MIRWDSDPYADDRDERDAHDTELDLDDRPREIPGIVACALCFVDDDLEGASLREARKHAIRSALVPPPKDWKLPGIMTTYDETGEVWRMIREVLAEG
jgi:hypothetical protein